MRGRLAIWLGQEEFQLRPGDSFYFTSQTPHRWYNPGRTETIILWINTPPTLDPKTRLDRSGILVGPLLS